MSKTGFDRPGRDQSSLDYQLRVSQCPRNAAWQLPVAWQFPLDATIPICRNIPPPTQAAAWELPSSFSFFFSPVIVLFFYTSLNKYMQALDDIGTTISSPWQLSAIRYIHRLVCDNYNASWPLPATSPKLPCDNYLSLGGCRLHAHNCHLTTTFFLAASSSKH